jgi:hypothetical protein
MPGLFRKFCWVLGLFAGGVITLVVGLFGFLMLTEFSPPKQIIPEIKGNGRKMNASQREFTFLTWNIGYAGLGCEQDFFYNGGKTVIPEQGQCIRYFEGIKKQVKARDTVDFIFLQEIDVYAKRSSYINEVSVLSSWLPGETGTAIHEGLESLLSFLVIWLPGLILRLNQTFCQAGNSFLTPSGQATAM